MVWKTPIFGCMERMDICCCSCFVGPLFAAKNAESIGENPVLWFMASFTPCGAGILRSMIRKKHGIEGSLAMDIACYMCCLGFLARTQETIQTGAADTLLEDDQLKKAAADVKTQQPKGLKS